ncbi:MAG: RNA chaperone Hfq [Armatimonadetes bacterium]|nr:RNA chaperone Hfq [Armatimonadota bacterium]
MGLNPEIDRPRPADERRERIPPHEAELIKYRDNRTPLLVKLVSGETLEGAIRWYDSVALRLVLSDRSEITVYRQAIAYYKARV